jgi:hypothetical protein
MTDNKITKRVRTHDAETPTRRGRAALPVEPQEEHALAQAAAAIELVTAVVPKAFTLTLDDHSVARYETGTQDMPRAHAEHWYSKAQGVEIYGE